MVLGPSKGYVQNNFWSNKIMTDVGIFEEIKLHDKIKKLKQLIKEKNDYIKIQDKENLESNVITIYFNIYS